MRNNSLIVFVVFVLILTSCGKSEKPPFAVLVEPTQKVFDSLRGTDYSIVLNDMDIEEKPNQLIYKHKYHLLKLVQDSLVVDSLDWQPVSKSFFTHNADNLGMEIMSSHNGNFSMEARPVGFEWAIGNPKYGEWEAVEKDSTKVTENTKRRWRPRGTTSMLFWYWMLRRPTYRSDYRGYSNRDRSTGGYYGSTSTGKTKYGTNSTYQKSKRPSYFNRVKSSNTWSRFNKRNGRSSSRYKKGSSTRSRSGGFGK